MKKELIDIEMTKGINQNPHRRYNALTGEWVLVSPHRTLRPWQGKEEGVSGGNGVEYEPKCYLCPGNERAGGKINPEYESTYVFTNDFAALLPELVNSRGLSGELFKTESVIGTSRVICFSPNHNLTIPQMEVEDIEKVIDVWIEQTEELGLRYKWVQIFENKGEIMGCSNPHPHGQIWAGSSLPNEAVKENRSQLQYFMRHKQKLLLDYLRSELVNKERVIIQNDAWAVMVPFWAVWPYETILLPKRDIQRITELSGSEISLLANILKDFLRVYDNLFNVSFPYTMGWHNAPFGDEDYNHWHLHAHFYPPLLRSATVKKFMVGYEMLSEAQRDITAEQAAETLRSLIK